MLSASWMGGGGATTTTTGCEPPLTTCCTDCLKDWLDPSGSATGKVDNGDPHITTADGSRYNFQGAGEYISLRNASGLEIQTRQTPVATTFNPGGLPDDGLTTCVSLNTAVAARVGKHRVTYEPNLSGVPDPSGLQLRVDGGDPITLGPAGLDLTGCGRIAQTAAPGGIEIDFPDHNALQVTPDWWFGNNWYLFVHVVRLSVMDGSAGAGTDGDGPAHISTRPPEGLMGTVPPGSWLPAPPDGTPVPAPPSYTGLYQTFGDAWRVTDKNSLFDYAPDTSTANFTIPSCAATDSGRASENCWPREIPPDWPPEIPRCLIPGTTPAEPVITPIAIEACRQITGKNTHQDCIFDVRATGNLGFAQTYLAQQQLQPGATKTTVKGDKRVTKYGHSVTFTATVVSAASSSRAITIGTVQFILDGSTVGSPLTLDSKGQATWSISSLQAGDLRVAASYTQSADSLYLASVSPYESHVVLDTFDLFMWLALLLLIIVLILIIWWYLRTI